MREVFIRGRRLGITVKPCLRVLSVAWSTGRTVGTRVRCRYARIVVMVLMAALNGVRSPRKRGWVRFWATGGGLFEGDRAQTAMEK